jgi:hypothetical protein
MYIVSRTASIREFPESLVNEPQLTGLANLSAHTN